MLPDRLSHCSGILKISPAKVDFARFNCIIVQMSDQSAIPIQQVSGRCCEQLAGDQTARFFRALGDPNRVALLARLADCGRACTVSELACCLPIDLSVVSRHLAQLRDAGILETEKRGREVRYRVRYDRIVTMLRELADAIDACCPTGCCSPSESDEKPPDAIPPA